jgi:hypothetical protein
MREWLTFLVSFLIALFPIDKVLYPLLLDLGNSASVKKMVYKLTRTVSEGCRAAFALFACANC